MKYYKNILFDLDGTLTDPGIGITNSVAYALKKYNIQVGDRSELYKFIGPPLHESFEHYYGFLEEEAFKAVDYYREYYSDKGIFENRVYEGIPQLLKDLKDAGKTLVVATSKPEVFAKQILEHFGLDSYFDYVAGSNLDGSRTKKEEVIRYALDSCNIFTKEQMAETIMIGDRKHDVLGAGKVSIDSIGVLFGYGDKEELEEAGATYIAETVKMLSSLLLT